MVLTTLTALMFLGGAGACVNSALYTSRTEAALPPLGDLIPVGDGLVHVIQEGETGPPVLMIHGASANAREFTETLAPSLSRSHRVLMADRPGHGYSDRVSNSEQLDAQAAQLAGALDHAAPGEKAVLVGHSFGGAVALRLALDRPDLVGGVVLLAPVTHDWGADSGAWYNAYAGPPVIGHAFTQLVPIVGPASVKSGIKGVFHPQPAPADYFDSSGVALLFRPSEFRANARDVNALRAEVAAQQTRYGELDVPIVVFSGAKDTVLKPQLHAARLVKDAPRVELVKLPETGHMPHHAHGLEIVEAITRLSAIESVQ
ncbi:MAG: alpha/beta hydrolase [Pseudomonadota bacterium]